MDLLLYAAPVVVFGAVFGVFYLRRKRMQATFETIARRQKGQVGKGPWGLFPRLILPIEGGEVQISGIQGSRNGRPTQTFAWIGSDDYPDLTLEIRRKPDRVGMLEKLGKSEANTGHRKFDDAFWLVAEDEKSVTEFLDKELRYALLAFDPHLRVRLRVGTLLAYPDGWRTAEMQRSMELSIYRLPPDVRDVERMLDVARMAHERLLRVRKAQAA